jgi:hypothetical protein
MQFGRRAWAGNVFLCEPDKEWGRGAQLEAAKWCRTFGLANAKRAQLVLADQPIISQCIGAVGPSQL